MGDDFKIISSADIISSVADFSKRDDNDLDCVWKKVVAKIGANNQNEESNQRYLGSKLSANSRVIDLKNGVLLVEANHSGWIQYLRMYQNFILKGLKWSLPSLKITSLAFRVRGTEASLSDIYENHFEKAQAQMDKKIERTERELENRYKKNQRDGGENEKTGEEKNPANSGRLPEELFKKLENLKNDMLTN